MKRLFKMIPMFVMVVLLADLFIVLALPDIALAAKSNLELKIRAADVEVVSTTTSEVAADYESSVYTVTINEKNGNWTVSIFSKIGNNIGQNPIKLYLPDLDYGNITLDIDSASFQCRAIKFGDIIATISNSSIDYVLPRGFSGSFKAGVANSNFELTSKDKYKDSKVTITNGGSAVISLPHYFTKKGWTATYTNGTQANVIEVISSDYGYIEIK
ncbi:hypothetical protein GM661_05390 [Iocasia frigidifontis]|uniref:Adhesin domain-containing protein n=1 Tax=Iocasia fonsfrigidae TaxID=2682810 RepID=A0A8A7KBI5_9FIRM|nr:hypothetical protein [Iocasia fonsfrigidae]QTL97455.1 hypothetical protein GM661_05390 [Iocasia fonsfrigidae]